jgi:hypothetical protein
MHRNNALKLVAIFVLLSFVMITETAKAGVFSDMKLWLDQRSQIKQHSRVLSSEVKTLYQERKSIKNFAEGANTLVQAYKSISKKSAKVNFPQLVEIATAITKVVKEYQNLAPKAGAMYQRSQPSLKYFSGLTDQTTTLQTSKNKIMVKGLSDKRINSLAAANGLGRIWKTVKSNPLNLFKWGRLSDEYKLGKVEAQYPLKCAQIAFEATAYFAAAKQSVQELIGIKSEIDGILGGNLDAILGMGDTVNKIKSVGPTAESLGDLANKGASHMFGRFGELLVIQQKYVERSREYDQKYNKEKQEQQTPSSSATTTSSGSYSPAPGTTGGIVSNSAPSAPVSLDKAMAVYQKAYENYIRLSQSGKADQTTLNKAISELQKAKQQVEQAKAQAR